MRAECIQVVTQALGRSLRSGEAVDIENRVRQQLKQMAIEDRQRFLSMSRDARMIEAGQRAAVSIEAEANLKKVRIALTIRSHDRIQRYLADMQTRGMDPMDAMSRLIAFKADGKSTEASVETRSTAISRQAISELTEAFEVADQGVGKLFGLIADQQGMRDLTNEIFGISTGNALAKKGAEAWHKVAEAMRLQFNQAGGSVGRLVNWALPQHHAQWKVADAAGSKIPVENREAWVGDIYPLLDRSKYVNEDGTSMSNDQTMDFLRHVWETISSGGANKLEPGKPSGKGMRAQRHSESREIHFSGPDAYLEYQAKYGEKDLWGLMTGHLNTLGKDIALLERFGPNPNLAYSYWRDTMVKAKSLADPKRAGNAQNEAVSLDNLYNTVAGHNLPIANRKIAEGFDTLRNWLVSTRLGSAFITSFSDEATLHLTGHVNNLPEMQLIRNELQALNPANRMELRMARRAGLALDTMIGELNRFGQEGLGASFSSKLANVTMRLSLLAAATDARKRAFGVTMYGAIGSIVRGHADMSRLDVHDNRILLSKGINQTDWNVWRLAQQEDWGSGNTTMLTPEAIARVSDAELQAAGLTVRDRRDAMQKLLGVVLEEVDMAVITPGARERAMMGAGLQRGTWKGELSRSFWLFKSFPVAMITRHWARGSNMETAGGKAAYIASLMVATTLLGGLSMTVDQILQGKDPRTFNPTEDGGIRNIIAAMLKGGSLGIYGDFLFSQATQGGHRGPLASLLGPVASAAEEVINLSQGNIVQLLQDKETHFGAESIRFLKGNVPAINLWYTKAALDRLIWNEAAEYLSPGYLNTIRNRARREFGQDYWLPMESMSPERAPDIEQLWRGPQ